MKTKLFLTVLLLITISEITFGQTAGRKRVAVLPLDAKGILLDPQQLSNLLRIELEKTELFTVMDRYDIQNIVEQKKINLSGCYGRTCLVEAGKSLDADKVMSGTVERYNEKILVNLRLIDVNSGNEEKSQIAEFLNLQPELQGMLSITLHNMFGIQNEPTLVARLTKTNALESSTNNPGVQKLALSGPRMGVSFLSGDEGRRLMAAKSSGGYDALPVMSQFGYQFETQYLNTGNFQALFEFIPMITGIDQGFFIPSMTILNGFRDNKSGWEFAFGPAFGLIKKAEGYYDDNGGWHMKDELINGVPSDKETVERLDRRGLISFSTGFVFAVGKTFRSASLNIPINGYIIPAKDGIRLGLSFGFNSKK